jgi:MoxR-like ATPase
MASVDIQRLNDLIQQECGFLADIRAEVRKVIVGQEYIIDRLLVGLLTHGHILLEGVPGLAKTLSVQTLARTVAARFQRIQFTPDLLPADLTGTMIFNPKSGEFHPRQGPLFAHLILADEINRAPAKVQSALLEAMQERQVTIGDTTFPLPEPFLVLATQNPIEQEGTYPLPEAQVDRFMLKLRITYPSRKEERDILDRMAAAPEIPVSAVARPEQILKAAQVVRQIYIDDKLKDYVVNLIYATRAPADYGLDLKPLIDYGASPRATIFMVRAAMAHACLNGRGFVIPEDIKAIALDVLRHRIILSYEAESEELTADDLITRVFDAIPVP